MEFSRPEYWRGSLSLLQGIFPTQGLNPGIEPRSPALQVDFYQLSHQGSPNNYMIKGKQSRKSPLTPGIITLLKYNLKSDLFHFWLLWVFVAARGASGCGGLSRCDAPAPKCVGFIFVLMDSAVLPQGIFLDQRSNPTLLHRQTCS